MKIIDPNDMQSVPKDIAVCPECHGALSAEIDAWETDTGIPSNEGIRVTCDAEEEAFWTAIDAEEEPEWEHRWWQGEWIGTIDKVTRWAQANLRIKSEETQ